MNRDECTITLTDSELATVLDRNDELGKLVNSAFAFEIPDFLSSFADCKKFLTPPCFFRGKVIYCTP